ncbi:E3 ubiquitin-protein ligase DTX1-like isoform X2 [Argiope bruennichi]|uniref:E3 ubiquitin-protein ligase DTX1-like isoform X2 n=1 Tax=Argiope bruennichi TaxID=94029 RepID=UPI00249506E5|nr:E3 ubiquitin-protein ligase DTX1-like isoform X2 [Argiope bruennichi]
MADNTTWKFVVWERLNKTGKWCPYSADVSQFLEQSYKKDLDEVSLSDVDENLKIYNVNFKDMVQISTATGTKSTIRRRMCNKDDLLCSGFTWQWHDDHDVWHSYDVEVNNFIEKAYVEGLKHVTLKKVFRGYNYEIDFKKMLQINKQTKRKRSIRRIQSASPYPVSTDDSIATQPTTDSTTDSAFSTVKDNGVDVSTVNELIRNEDVNNHDDLLTCDTNQNSYGNQSHTAAINNSTVALVNGRPWFHSRPPHTPQSLLKPVPGIDPISACSRKTKRKKKVKLANYEEMDTGIEDVLSEYTKEVNLDISNSKDEDCIICCEPLSGGSSYDDDCSIVQLKLCPHIFHKSCLLAMYNSGPKDKCLQCPVCKKIHGVKYGIQPPGDMIYHILPYSLPGYPECDTIRIIYDIPSGTQGPEHPMPGKKYTSRGFPRHCFLPDNEMGRKVLRLLIKAWKRRLIFTIGRSSTTGEENTVTWNEIHHKTEFGYSRRGHGFPDPNYFNNVLAELEAHGVVDDDVYMWYPA